jgi:squalene monooxygenase
MEGYSSDVAGRSFHHGRFVQRLRYAAAAVPDVCVREGTVRRLINGEAKACRAGRSSSNCGEQKQQQQPLKALCWCKQSSG